MFQSTEEFLKEKAPDATFTEVNKTTTNLNVGTRVTIIVEKAQIPIETGLMRLDAAARDSVDLADYESKEFAKAYVGAVSNQMSITDWKAVQAAILEELHSGFGMPIHELVNQFHGGADTYLYETKDLTKPNAPKSERFSWYVKQGNTTRKLEVVAIDGCVRKFGCGASLEVLSPSSAIYREKGSLDLHLFASKKELGFFI